MLFTSSLLSCLPQGKHAATPLLTASVENHIEVARFLIEHGASINYLSKVFDNFLYVHNLFTIQQFHHRAAGHLFKLHVTVVIQTSSNY